MSSINQAADDGATPLYTACEQGQGKFERSGVRASVG
jgi:hypothetical protein